MHTTHRYSERKRWYSSKRGARNAFGNTRPIVRPSLKKASAEKILPQVRGIVSGMKIAGKVSFFKENIARKLRVHVRYVEQCLHILNLEGLVSKPVHSAAPDSNRDVWGGNMSGWVGDIYHIR